MHIVLVHPEIPHNTGAAGRLALGTGSTLHLIEPLGFSLDEKQIRRVGLDYWKDVDLKVWTDWETFIRETGAERLHLCTTKATTSLWETEFRSDDFLVFGPETTGLSQEMRDRYADSLLRIPMASGGTRSLNLSTAIAIVLYEAQRQVGTLS